MKLIDDDGHEVDIYSENGLSALGRMWIKASAQHKLMYEPVWMGRPIIQFSDDILMMQELFWNVRPTVIVETGIAHGGSAVFYASMLNLMGIENGRVIAIDIDIRPHNRESIEAHPMADRIEMIEGSSIAPEVVADVKGRIADGERVLVTLDSDHTRDHVYREMELYAPLVSNDSYMVAMDGAQAWVHDIPRGKAEWEHDHPLQAIHEFLEIHPEWEIDPHYNRMHITSNPDAFLRRRSP